NRHRKNILANRAFLTKNLCKRKCFTWNISSYRDWQETYKCERIKSVHRFFCKKGVEVVKSSISRFFGLGEKNIENNYKKDEVKQLPVNKIVPNRFQPRTVFDDDKIEELAQTLKTHGMIQPIVVRKQADRYEIIAGERRFRAVKKLGWDTIPAIIRDFDDAKTASVALIENLQREELSVIEEAAAYAKLIELHGLTQESLAQRLGKSQSTIANKLRLLKLPEKVQQALLNKQITERHGRALMSLKDEEKQLELLDEIIEKQLNEIGR